jgi:hypothetical protein
MLLKNIPFGLVHISGSEFPVFKWRLEAVTVKKLMASIEDRGSMFLWNVAVYLQAHMALQPDISLSCDVSL